MVKTIFLVIFFGIFFYVTHQVLEGAQLPWVFDAFVIGFIGTMFGMVLALPLYFWMASRDDHKPWYDRFYFYTYLGLAYINFLIFIVIFRDLFALTLFAFQQNYDPSQIYNRNAMAILLVLPMLMILVGTWIVRVGVRHREVMIAVPGLPTALQNFRILHITDLHIGESLPTKFIEHLLRTAAKLSVDAVVFTGDILDGEVLRFQKDLELLKQLKSRFGTFYVPGNHEYYWQGQRTIEAFRKLGFHVLINETHTLKIEDAVVQISGVPDPEAKTFRLEEPDFQKLIPTLQPNAFKILLSHQPWIADLAAPLGFQLQLSGHTHGGQFFPWNYLVSFVQKYSKGLYQIQSLQLYVNQGAGYWGPSVRLGTHCELAEIVLTRGAV
jgi:predicted MPP superfamily phosphohydrolase